MANEEMLRIITNYLHSQPVLKAYLFGSYARNEEDEKSDIDLLMQFDEQVSLLTVARIQNELEDALQIKVDIVSTGGLSPLIQPYIDKDKILIYERAA